MYMYEVCAKCGHVGKNYYVDKVFAIKANNAKEAAAKTRNIPRVKHDHKDAIRYVKQVDRETFSKLLSENNDDEFLQCKSVQEQRQRCKAVYEERRRCEQEREWIPKIEEENRRKYFHKIKLRNPKKYFNNYNSYYEEYMPC